MRLASLSLPIPLLVAGLLAIFPAAAAEPTLPNPLPDGAFAGIFKGYKDCRAKFATIDARVDAAGVRDAGYYRVPGFPYFRTDRLLASFANEVHDLASVSGWMQRMRQFDQEARASELINLGMSGDEIGLLRYELLSCASGLANLEMQDEDNLAFLRKSVAPPTEYASGGTLSAKQRKDVAARAAALLKSFTGKLPAATAQAPLKLWKAKPIEDLSLIADGYGRAMLDELGVPALIESQWRGLAEVNAPVLWIETASPRDRPGKPVLSNDAASVDPTQPLINYYVTFTRFGSARLTQLNYFIWFKGRAGAASADKASASQIDGLIWRVTLDQQARPLLYESVHATGRDHLWFLAQPLARRSSGAPADDSSPALFPQAEPISGPVALRLAAGSHALRRVVPLAKAVAVGGETIYELRRYEDLFSLPRPDGQYRNLYGPDGTIPSVREHELAWLWGDRVPAPGALRELGRLPVSYSGQTHFDDADLLERLFVVPAAAAPKETLAGDAAGFVGPVSAR